MKRAQIDVDIVIPLTFAVQNGGFQKIMPSVLRMMREEASSRVSEKGGTIVPTIEPDVIAKEGIDPILGESVIVSCRWTVDLPESAEVVPER